MCGDALDEVAEGSKLSLEALVEALGNLLNIESPADEGDNVGNPDASRFVLQSDDETIQALQQRLSSLSHVELVLPAGGGFASLPLDPLPNLLSARGIYKDDEVLEGLAL